MFVCLLLMSDNSFGPALSSYHMHWLRPKAAMLTRIAQICSIIVIIRKPAQNSDVQLTLD